MSFGRTEARCERKGHKWVIQSRRGYEDGHPEFDFWHFRCVGHAVAQERKRCCRCKTTTAWETVDDHCIQSLTLSSDLSQTLRRDKVVWV